MRTRSTALVCLLAALLPAVSRAEDLSPTEPPGVRFEQRLDQQVPLDAMFQDETNHTVRLGDYFGDKPVILVLAYYRCPRLCTQVLNQLLDSLKGVPLNAGRDFQVVIVSFDAREKPALATAKKESYVEEYRRPGAAEGWHFLTGPQESIDQLTEAVGFHYVYDKKLDQFAHRSGIMVVTPQGKIARYFPGLEYPPNVVRFSLIEASEGKIGSPVDAVFLLCYHYDPATGKYTPTVMNFVRLAGALTLVFLGVFLGFAWRREWLNRRKMAVP